MSLNAAGRSLFRVSNVTNQLLMSGSPTSSCSSSTASSAVRAFSTAAGAATATDEVLFEKVGSATVVTMNRPSALNALNLNMIRAMYPKYREFERDHKHVVILKGTGGKSFCAGGDIVALYSSRRGPTASASNTVTSDFFREEYKLNNTISKLPAHVALLNGITMGGGVGVSVHGKYRVATDNTLFAMPETAIGFFCDVGGSYFLSRLPHHLGMYLALTGNRLKGYDVFSAGVATHFVPSAKFEELQKALTSHKIGDVQSILDSFHEKHESRHLNHLLPYIEKIFSRNSVEQIYEGLKAETTNATHEISEWAKTSINALNNSSPTSLKVVFQQIRRGEKLPLDECLKMEYRMSQAFIARHDFFEGVRALLVDKDKKPKWNPSSIEAVSDQLVEAHFEKLSPEAELKFDH